MAAQEFDERHLQLGYVAGAHGVLGGLKVKLFNPDSTAIDVGVSLVLRPPAGRARTFDPNPAAARPAGVVGGSASRSDLDLRFVVSRVATASGPGALRVWFDGVGSREAADALRGHELWIDRAELPALGEDEYYLADLVGLEVVRDREGVSESLGRITGVTSNTAQDLLCVRLRGQEWLLPAMPPFIVSIEKQRVLVDVHDDMLPDPDERGSA
jgi:16S rRNA processing protein RimM